MEPYQVRAEQILRRKLDSAGMAFFSSGNLKVIQEDMVREVKDATGLHIAAQDPDQVFLVMQYIYNNPVEITREEKVPRLNTRVVNACVKQLVQSVRYYVQVQEDQDRGFTPPPREIMAPNAQSSKELPMGDRQGVGDEGRSPLFCVSRMM